MDRPWERVHTVNDWYDGPRAGFADVDGVPHAYRSEWLTEAQVWDPAYRLFPVDPGVFALALEDWAIWQRWEDAFYTGRTTQATHPALPEDAARHAEIYPTVDRFLEEVPDDARRATAEFRVAHPNRESPLGRMRELEVRWNPVEIP